MCHSEISPWSSKRTLIFNNRLGCIMILMRCVSDGLTLNVCEETMSDNDILYRRADATNFFLLSVEACFYLNFFFFMIFLRLHNNTPSVSIFLVSFSLCIFFVNSILISGIHLELGLPITLLFIFAAGCQMM